MVKTKVEEKFSEFLEKWFGELEDLVKQIEELSETEKAVDLVGKVTTHIKSYYKEKWECAHNDVMAFYCPIWMNPLEKILFQWVTDWKPSIVFRLVNNQSMKKDLSEQQLKKIDDLRVKIKMDEDKVEREMERQQVSMSHGDQINEYLVSQILCRLEKLMKMADCVRLKAIKGVIDQLTPTQSLRFFASLSLLFLHIRKNTTTPPTTF